MMTVNGLGQFDMMSAYNRIENIVKVPAVTPKQEVKPVEPVQKQEETNGIKINLNLDGIRSKSNASLDDISRDFAKRDRFSITNFDADFMQSEMDRAVSEMNMDASLKQYQYFVGDSNVITNDEDGIVIMK